MDTETESKNDRLGACAANGLEQLKPQPRETFERFHVAAGSVEHLIQRARLAPAASFL